MIVVRKVHFIVNPVSGRSGSARLVDDLGRRLRSVGCEVWIRKTAAGGDCRRFAAESMRERADFLVVVGGDGTVNEAADGLLAMTDSTQRGATTAAPSSGHSVPILVVPTGTENLLARYLGIRADVDELWRILQAPRCVTLDAGTVNGRTFLMVAGMGFDAEVVRRLSTDRRGHIHYGSYFGPLWRSFWSYRQPQVSVEADGVMLFEGRGMVFVGNIPRYAIGLRLLDRATPFDGLLDVCVFDCSWQGPLLRHAVSVLLRRHIGTRGVVYRQAKHVRVGSKTHPIGQIGQVAVPMELDGDLAGELPAEFGIRPSAVSFLVREGWQA